jgi:hypothetical protein
MFACEVLESLGEGLQKQGWNKGKVSQFSGFLGWRNKTWWKWDEFGFSMSSTLTWLNTLGHQSIRNWHYNPHQMNLSKLWKKLRYLINVECVTQGILLVFLDNFLTQSTSAFLKAFHFCSRLKHHSNTSPSSFHCIIPNLQILTALELGKMW